LSGGSVWFGSRLSRVRKGTNGVTVAPLGQQSGPNVADKSTVALLGTGSMGSAIGRTLLKAGFPVRAWNRTLEKAKPLAEQGAVLVQTPASTVDGAQVIITMLRDGDAVLHTMQPGQRRGSE
jgi:phosphoglycerate dehydrogenase-like enzyme